MSKFVIRATETGVKFDLVAKNGEPVGTSQVYTGKATCKAGIASVKRTAGKAKVEDQTAREPQKLTNPKFEIYADKAGQIRFRLRASNGREILASQGYASKDACEKGIASVVKNAPDAAIADETKQA